jgi:hypothetical protein
MTPTQHRPKPAADLTLVSRGLPADWEILRDGTRVGHVLCPDAETALILATYRHGVGVTVRRQGATS